MAPQAFAATPRASPSIDDLFECHVMAGAATGMLIGGAPRTLSGCCLALCLALSQWTRLVPKWMHVRARVLALLPWMWNRMKQDDTHPAQAQAAPVKPGIR